jgi:hypothetical protein
MDDHVNTLAKHWPWKAAQHLAHKSMACIFQRQRFVRRNRQGCKANATSFALFQPWQTSWRHTTLWIPEKNSIHLCQTKSRNSICARQTNCDCSIKNNLQEWMKFWDLCIIFLPQIHMKTSEVLLKEPFTCDNDRVRRGRHVFLFHQFDGWN